VVYHGLLQLTSHCKVRTWQPRSPYITHSQNISRENARGSWLADRSSCVSRFCRAINETAWQSSGSTVGRVVVTAAAATAWRQRYMIVWCHAGQATSVPTVLQLTHHVFSRRLAHVNYTTDLLSGCRSQQATITQLIHLLSRLFSCSPSHSSRTCTARRSSRHNKRRKVTSLTACCRSQSSHVVLCRHLQRCAIFHDSKRYKWRTETLQSSLSVLPGNVRLFRGFFVFWGSEIPKYDPIYVKFDKTQRTAVPNLAIIGETCRACGAKYSWSF